MFLRLSIKKIEMRYSVFLLAIFLLSCVKDHTCDKCGNEYENAVILDAGNVAADGCGWVVKTDSTHHYHPEVLDDSFKQNGLHVKICFEKTGGNFFCGFNPNPLPVIRVIDIRY